jgi:hypothetical protein
VSKFRKKVSARRRRRRRRRSQGQFSSPYMAAFPLETTLL